MAETWITLSETDIRTALAGNELEAVRNAARYGTEADPVSGIMASVTEYVRGHIARNPRNQLGPSGTLPSCIKEVALPLVVWRIMARSFGEVVDPSGFRKDAMERAERTLRDIAEGRGMVVPVPNNPITDSRPIVPIQYSNASGELVEMTREDQNGASI